MDLNLGCQRRMVLWMSNPATLNLKQMKMTESICSNCAFHIKDGRAFRCGFDYYQVPAAHRRTPKLTNFPEVAANNSCPRWDPNGFSVLKPSAESGAPQKADTTVWWGHRWLNSPIERGTVKVSTGRIRKEWGMRQERKSPNYTTDWSEVPVV